VYNHQQQVLKFSFSYFNFRWCTSADNTPTLSLENANDEDFGILTNKMPVIGLRVRIWWESFGESYSATVKRWSKKYNSWVLKYDLWKDTVVENVPVVKWEFIE